jgi:hypothetical protein
MDEWLRDWLVRSKIIRQDGISQRVRTVTCEGCKRLVLRALDGDVAAMAVTLDVGEVDRIGELLALMQDRRTYSLYPLNDRKAYSYQIIQRTAAHIGRMNDNHPVVVEHRCDKDIPKVWKSRNFRPLPDEPPF